MTGELKTNALLLVTRMDIETLRQGSVRLWRTTVALANATISVEGAAPGH